MGRSVSVPNDATVVCYKDVSQFEDQWDWEYFVTYIQESCKSVWKSFYDADSWLDNEDHVILENELVKVGVSEYCGLASIWIIPEEENIGLAVNFSNQIENKFKAMFNQLNSIGRASNGEQFFEVA